MNNRLYYRLCCQLSNRENSIKSVNNLTYNILTVISYRARRETFVVCMIKVTYVFIPSISYYRIKFFSYLWHLYWLMNIPTITLQNYS